MIEVVAIFSAMLLIMGIIIIVIDKRGKHTH